MPRIHFFEIVDQNWCPNIIRDCITDYLQYVEKIFNIYDPIIPKFVAALQSTNSNRVVDLCSGGSGPWLRLYGKLDSLRGTPTRILLTDKYPNIQAMHRVKELAVDNISYNQDSVDATQVPAELTGFRTVFTGFHHFHPSEARAVLEDAHRKGEGVAVFEFTDRNLWGVFSNIVGSLLSLLITPFIRPFKWRRLVFTYLLPAIPLVMLFDGVVSCLRTYSPRELRAITDAFDNSHYEWDIGRVRVKGMLIWVTYLIGHPRVPDSHEAGPGHDV